MHTLQWYLGVHVDHLAENMGHVSTCVLRGSQMSRDVLPGEGGGGRGGTVPHQSKPRCCVCFHDYSKPWSCVWKIIEQKNVKYSEWSLVQYCSFLQMWSVSSYIHISWEASYGTRRFITVATTARYWSLSWAKCIQSIPSRRIPYDWF
jgi:hypothetical protein